MIYLISKAIKMQMGLRLERIKMVM